MNEKEFNLLFEPWILVMRKDGEVEEVSLLGAFERAHEFLGLSGELPTQDIAVLRLLLAVLHAVFARYDLRGNEAPLTTPNDALMRFKALYESGAFPMDVIRAYLAHFEERFYLFHPTRPFYQVAALRNRQDVFGPFKPAKLNGILCESDNEANRRLFPQRALEGKSSLTYAEAARWLLYTNAFTETFGKLAAKNKLHKDDPSPGVGWLGKLGLVAAEGSSLFETLLLNLVLIKDGESMWGKEKPIWEEAHERINERVQIVLPDNQSELLTLQSRRFLLTRKDGVVTSYILLAGDFFLSENAFSEQMTMWRNASKEGSPPRYLPKLHDPARSLWRDFPSLFSQSEQQHHSGVINWIYYLRSKDMFRERPLRIRTTGVIYSSQLSAIEDSFSDSMTFSFDILSKLNADWVSRIIGEIELTEKLVRQTAYLAKSIAMASGDADGKSDFELAAGQSYFRLDLPFREWLSSLNPEVDDLDGRCDEWFELAQQIVRKLGGELVSQAGVSAFVGREVSERIKGNAQKRRYTAPEAYNQFLYFTSTRSALTQGG